jgi:4-hydroxybenzoate polyprenyltransferase
MSLRNLGAYLGERFPVVNMALFAILFGTVFTVAGRAGAGAGGLLPAVGLGEIEGMAATISFFFRLRVFDEIKDFASDAVLHPQRVLQSGRVKLESLRALAWAGAGLEIAWSIHRGGPAVLGWGVLLAYSLLMRYEFGAPAWLRARLLLYALTHMLIMPLVIGWLWLAYAPAGLFGPGGGLLLALLSLLGGFAFELARKIRTPAAERPGVDSYSRNLGYGGAVGAVLLVLLASAGVQALLLGRLGAGRGAFGLLAGLLVLAVATYSAALLRPREQLVRAAEKLVSLALLTSYVAVIVSVRW